MPTAIEAKYTPIFYIERIGQDVEFIHDNYKYIGFLTKEYVIKATTMFDLILKSVNLVKTPNGYTPDLFIDEVNGLYYLNLFLGRGFEFKTIAGPFVYPEDAEELFFSIIYTNYNESFKNHYETFETLEQAEERLSRLYSKLWNVAPLVAKSILRKRNIVENLRRERYVQHLREHQDAETDRINSLAIQYIDLIEPRKESYEQTCARLKDAIGARIDQKVFHAAVRTIRFRYSDSMKGKNN